MAIAALGAVSLVQAQGKLIYSCTDAQGRRITSDQPIPSCLDRPQKEYGASGTVLRIRPPTPTAVEHEQLQEQKRQAALERQRQRDAIRRDQALVARYPNQAAHDSERAKALAQTEQVIKAAEQRIADLGKERQSLNQELEFYASDPARTPAKLERAIAGNIRAIDEQKQAIAGQYAEQKRIHARFDKEAADLKVLWTRMEPPKLPER